MAHWRKSLVTAKAAAKRGEGKGGGVVPLLIDVVVDVWTIDVDSGRSSFIVDVSFAPSLCFRHSTPRLQNTSLEFVPYSSTSSTKMDDTESPPFSVM
jgi:hypothetical protein